MIIRLILFLLCLNFSTYSYALHAETYYRYSDSAQVTAGNLNGNFDNLRNVVNGGLDNTNADVNNGYRFIEIVGALPAAGTQGRVVFLTTNNTLYFDTGAAWVPVVTMTVAGVQGDMIYHNGSGWTTLNKDASASRYVSNTGTSNNPAWAKVELSDGAMITGQMTGDIFFASSPTVISRLPIGASGSVLVVDSGAPTWSALGIETGTVANGATIALPSGYSADRCDWMTALGDIDGGTSSGGAFSFLRFTADVNRQATCQGNKFNWVDGSSNTTINGTCNYIIICK